MRATSSNVWVHHQRPDQLREGLYDAWWHCDRLVAIKCGRFSIFPCMNVCRKNLCSLLQMTPLQLPSHQRGNDRQAWSLWGWGLRCWPSVSCTWWTVWLNLLCSGRVDSTAVLFCVDWCYDHRKQLHVWNTSSSGSNYNKSQFLLRLSAQLRRETINAHHRLLLGAHVNLTENTIVSPATWNMFSHA